ncbi:unnamed protein product [Absidia cylindrospora]
MRSNFSNTNIVTCTLVDKSFYKNAILLLWQELDIDTDDALHTITNTLEASSNNTLGDLVRSVTIDCKLSDDDLLAFIKHVPLLTDLSLDSAHYITDDSFVHVPRHVPHLTRFYICAADITQRSMEAIGRHWQYLEQLALVCCNALDYNMFEPLTRCSTTLTSLMLRHCSLAGLETPDTAQLAARNILSLRHLTTLQFVIYEYDYHPFINALWAGEWPDLMSLYLEPCCQVTDTMTMALLRSHPKLTEFGLSHSLITDKTLDALATRVPEIVEVSVGGSRGLTADGLRRLVKTCPKLETVDCDYCGIYPEDFPRTG